MKVYHPKTIKEAIDSFQQFLECDLYSKFKPDTKIKGEVWTRDDIFTSEEEFLTYLQNHFDILRNEIKRIKKK